HSRLIDYLPCKDFKTRQKGVCMFAQYCSLANGTHLASCKDGFIYMSCCKLPPGVTGVAGVFSIVTNEIEPIVPNGEGNFEESTENSIMSNSETENTEITSTFTTASESFPQMSHTTNREHTSSTTFPPSSPHITTWRPKNTTSINTVSPVSLFQTGAPETSTETVSASHVTIETIQEASTEYPYSSTTERTKNTASPTLVDEPSPLLTTKQTTIEQFTNVTGIHKDEQVTKTWTSSEPETETLSPTTVPSPSSNSSTSNEASNFRTVCGSPHLGPVGRIVGGETSDFGEWPWMISLRQWKKNKFIHKCGAALLNELWAITAAHCVQNVPSSQLLLRLGEYNIHNENEPISHIERRVQLVASYPKFDRATFEYDLALLRFYEPVTFQRNILPICIPSGNKNYVGQNATITGWGRLYEDGPLPDILQNVDVSVITNRDCMDMYRKAGYIEDIPDIFICAGLSKGGLDSCEGDSGGPMVIQEENGRWILAGIISWGIGCALPNQPGVYTRITKFSDWINQIIVF
ncbi:serine proteinase stubble-like, partial [Limulus polyphemus]|uniref:Serine proteinase stubble-like n=1 Tax=Limulus polyphemus TaxID=6850 RepID=A0ABM1BLB9_LIMPO